jgi:hypothetical protein
MQAGLYWRTVFIGYFLFVCSCTPSYNTVVSESRRKGYELIIAKDSDIVDAASVAIRNYFSGVDVSGLSGQGKGFTFNTR